ncbi:hypothetical protein Tco_0520841 [Tanacetum coccineum]
MIHTDCKARYEKLEKEKQTKNSKLKECVLKKDRQHILRANDDFIIFENLQAQVQELNSENEHLKSKVIDFITFSNLQVQVTAFKSENEGLKLLVEELTKYNDLLALNDPLKQRLVTKFKFLKHDTSLKKMIEMIEKEYESNVSKISVTSSMFQTRNLKLVKEMGDNMKRFDEDKKVFENKISKLENVLSQRVKDFDDVKTKLSRRTDKFETYFANLEKENALLKSQLTSQNYTSLQKENNDLRTSYNVLNEKFDQVSQRIKKYGTFCEELEKENGDLKMHYKRL